MKKRESPGKVKLNFIKMNGLLPVVIQDYQNDEVLMVGFMNEEAWKKTLQKFLWVTAEVIVAGALVYITDNQILLTIAPLLHAGRNWLKHRNK